MEKKNVFFLFSNISGNNGKKRVISVPLVSIMTILKKVSQTLYTVCH